MLSLHVLDTAAGAPAAGIAVTLQRIDGAAAVDIALGTTDADGRITPGFGGTLTPGTYELRFNAGAYFSARGVRSFYTEIPVRFCIDDSAPRYHIPLLLSPFGYTTYRGS